MEFSITLVVALVGLWYLKNALTDTLETTGRMASSEIAQAEADQIIRHHKMDEKRTEKYAAITSSGATILTAQDIINMKREGKI